MTSTPVTPDLLSTIIAATHRVVEVRSEAVPTGEMERRAALVSATPGSFRAAISKADRVNVIAECKRRSPSRGVLKADYDAVAIATGYEANGAAAISVLTEPTFFDGAIEHLQAVRQAVGVPVLRKDFIVSKYQILEARACGANAILLIVAALSPGDLRDLLAFATKAGLDTLVEVHGADELQPALDAGAEIIGVNNRNLRTLQVNPDVSAEFIGRLPAQAIAVAESGLKSGSDIRRFREAGYHAFLIGERFMTTDDPGAALANVLKEAR